MVSSRIGRIGFVSWLLLALTLPFIPVHAETHAPYQAYEHILAPNEERYFGEALAWHGDSLVVGVGSKDQVRIMGVHQGEWAILQTLQGVPRSSFGHDIAIDGDIMVISAPSERIQSQPSGAVYVYRHGSAGWSEIGRLTSHDSDYDFGITVAVSGSWIAVSSTDDSWGNDGLSGSNFVYLYQVGKESVTEKQALSEPSLLNRKMFGYSIDLKDSRLVVGAPGQYYEEVVEPGAVYIYERSGATWSLDETLQPDPLSDGGGYGIIVDQNDSDVVICDDFSVYALDDHRSIQIYRKSGATWTKAQEFQGHGCSQLEVEGTRMLTTEGSYSRVLVYQRVGNIWSDDGRVQNSRPGEIAMRNDIAALGYPRYSGGQIILIGHNTGPVADFDAPPPATDFAGDGFETLTFSGVNSTGHDISYYWTVDGELRGTGPELTLDLAVGEHKVRLAVSDPMMGTSQATKVVTVHGPPPPEPDFSWLPGTIEGGEPIRFVDESTSSYGHIVEWNWDMNGDDLVDATGPSVTWEFESSGSTKVSLLVRTDLDTEASITKSVVVQNQPPVADAGMDQIFRDQDPDASVEVSLDGTGSSDSDGTVKSFSWARDGKRFSTSSMPTLDLKAGVHDFDLTVTDNKGAKDTDRVTVLILENGGAGSPNGTSGATLNKPTAQFAWERADGPPERAVAFTDRSGDADNRIVMWWYDLGGDGSYEATEPNPVIGFPSLGSHDVELTVTDETGLQSTFSTNVFLKNGAPTAIIETRTTEAYVGQQVLFLDNSTDPEGSAMTRSWDFGDGGKSTELAPSHTYEEAGSFTVRLSVEDADGSTSKDEVTIRVRSVPAGTTIPPIAGGSMVEQVPESPYSDESVASDADATSDGKEGQQDKDSKQEADSESEPFGISAKAKPNGAAAFVDPAKPWLWIGIGFVAVVFLTSVISVQKRR